MLGVLGAVLALAGFASAQANGAAVSSAGPGWKPGNCGSPQWQRALSQHEESLQLFGSIGHADNLEELHKVLRNSREPHDAYLTAEEIGNEETVPLLLDRLRLDYGPSEPPVTPGKVQGFICTQIHLADALRSITNTDQGPNYPRWAAWWAANRTFSRQRWIFDGFAAGGLHPVDPVDERFGLELIEALASERLYYRRNAQRLLSGVPAETRAKWLSTAASSDRRTLRLGTLDDLSYIDQTGREDLLRVLTRDSDLEVRRNALTALNARLEKSPSTHPPAGGCFCRMEGPSVESVAFAGDLLITAYDDRVRAYDTKTLRELWSRPTGNGIGELVLIAGQQVILASRYGALLALDLEGRVQWSRQADSQNWTDENRNEVTRLIRYSAELIVVRWHSVERLNLKSGAAGSTYNATGFVGGADATETSMCLVDGSGLRCEPGGNRDLSHAHAVSVSQDLVCTVAGDWKDQRLACLSANTLSQLWQQPVFVKDDTPVQDGPRLFVYTWDELMALRSADGSILWATRETGYSNRLLPTEYGLLSCDPAGRVELRDPQTGEFRRVWPQVHWMSGGAAVHGEWAAIADLDVVWLIDLSSHDQPGGGAFELKHEH